MQPLTRIYFLRKMSICSIVTKELIAIFALHIEFRFFVTVSIRQVCPTGNISIYYEANLSTGTFAQGQFSISPSEVENSLFFFALGDIRFLERVVYIMYKNKVFTRFRFQAG